jgi:amino acid adenylation domain-containing protein
VIEGEVGERLAELSREEGATLYMTLLGSFAALLQAYTGGDEVVVGTPVAGRNRTEVEGLIGFFINTLVMRTEVRGEESFRELLGRVREVVLAAYAHQDLPFEKLVEELHVERSLSHTPLFQVMFIMQNMPPASDLNLGDLSIEPLAVSSGTVKYDLILNMSEVAGSIGGTMQYNADLFDAATIKRMLDHFQTLLKGIVSHPGRRLSELPLLSGAERRETLSGWNDTDRDYPRRQCIHQLFEAQAEQTPDAVALGFEGEQLTYGELNRRANQLAHRLLTLGVKPETLVGICMERSPEMLVGVLGVLKSGGAYVPLDPLFPRQRLQYMLEDASVAALLTQQHIAAELPEHGAEVISLDTEWESIGRESAENPRTRVASDNLAYVIYTSGSTGQPKGVQIPHYAVVNFLNSMRRAPGLTSEDTLLAVTTLSFDIAGLELFLPLIAGGRVEIGSGQALADGEQFIKLIERSGATAMQATPATWRLLLELDWPGSESMKILCGGEALPRELADRLIERGAAVWNLFGPTETTIWSSTCRVEPGDNPVSIGRPIDNTQMYVLNRSMEPLPVKVAGELYIGGDGLARGYNRAPHLTASKFVPDPFSGKPGARLYKTGDLARYLPGGALEHLGRIDHQVKLRGFRIELGEIEAALKRHASVRESVVVAREDSPGDKRLVAYIVCEQEPPPAVDELRRQLRERLPDYMLPSAFVMLPSLPLTPNGKIDRRALPPPEHARPELKAAYAPPRSAAERVVASIWQEALQLEKVGRHDNFFDLGGHSLLTIQVHRKLREEFDKDLTVVDIFKYPTISSLADYLTQEQDTAGAAQAEQQRGANRKTSMKRRRQLKQKSHTAAPLREESDE